MTTSPKGKTKMGNLWHWVWLALVILGAYYVYGHWVAKKF